MKKDLSQMELIMEFFKKHPNKDIKHPQVVDWVVAEWKKKTGQVLRDPDRGIRKLHQQGKLIKVKKGIYRYNPNLILSPVLEEFTQAQKKQIFERDGYKCVICGLGDKDGLEIHADHIVPRDKGGKAEIDNGQTLCSIHNFRKKNYNQTESGKKMFILLWKNAKKIGDKKMQKFCETILKTYHDFDINGHIEWDNN